jgi:hypothetical protein
MEICLKALKFQIIPGLSVCNSIQNLNPGPLRRTRFLSHLLGQQLNNHA